MSLSCEIMKYVLEFSPPFFPDVSCHHSFALETFHRVCTGRNHANPSWVANFDLFAAVVVVANCLMFRAHIFTAIIAEILLEHYAKQTGCTSHTLLVYLSPSDHTRTDISWSHQVSACHTSYQLVTCYWARTLSRFLLKCSERLLTGRLPTFGST